MIYINIDIDIFKYIIALPKGSDTVAPSSQKSNSNNMLLCHNLGLTIKGPLYISMTGNSSLYSNAHVSSSA